MTEAKGVFKSVSGKWFVLVFLALASIIPSHAQAPTGTILGTVKDSSGGAVAGAGVTAANTETGTSRMISTGEDGSYRIDALPVGHYSVKIGHTGFKTFNRNDLVLDVSQEAVVNASLEVGAATQAQLDAAA